MIIQYNILFSGWYIFNANVLKALVLVQSLLNKCIKNVLSVVPKKSNKINNIYKKNIFSTLVHILPIYLFFRGCVGVCVRVYCTFVLNGGLTACTTGPSPSLDRSRTGPIAPFPDTGFRRFSL